MRTYLIFLLTLIGSFSYSQEPSFNGVAGMGSINWDQGYSLVTDSSGNIYTTGTFRNTIDMDPGPNVFNLNSNGDSDIFIQKLSSNGSLIWALSIGGIYGDAGIDIEVVDDFIYVCGIFTDTVDFDPGNGTFFLNGSNHGESFVLKLSTSGSFIWAGAFLGNYLSSGYRIEVDSSYNIYTLGYFSKTVDFDPGPGVFELTAPGTTNAWDIFVQKMDSSGNFIWAGRIGGPSEEYPGSFGLDQQANIIINGSFMETADFDPDEGIYNLTSKGHRDIFVVKLTSQGDFIWAISHGSELADEGETISVDQYNNIYSGGNFMETIDFDPGSGVFNLTAENYYDTYIQKLASDGSFIWAISYENVGLINSNIDLSGNIYTTGHFGATTDFDPGPEVFNLVNKGVWDAYIQKLDTMGNFSWAKGFGGSGFEQGKAIHINNNDEVFLTGYYSDTVYFNPDSIQPPLRSMGDRDAFIVKLGFCETNYDTLVPIVCDSYMSPSSNHIWTSSGIYFDTIDYLFGCDSIFTIDLTVINIDASVIMSGATLTAVDTNCTYQWIDCNNGNLPIMGETYQVFVAEENGSYAVVLTNNECVDTSSCYDIVSVYSQNQQLETAISIYPVPVVGSVSIDFGRQVEAAIVKVSNIQGRNLMEQQIRNTRFTTIKLDVVAGIYIISIDIGNNSQSYKFVKR